MVLPASMDYPLLFEPIDVGPVTLANRLVRSAHGTGLGMPAIGDDFAAYTETAAADGFGLIVLEDASPHRSSPPAAGILAWDDGVRAGYERLVAAVEPYGTPLFQQVMHSGGYRPRADGGAPWAPSAIPYVGYAGLPLAMTQAMIDELVEAHAAVARRAREGGLRGLELHCAHGYLVAQFLSPLTNHRDDAYGGGLENRVRFAREVLAAMRAEAGPGLAVGVRLSSDEAHPGTLGVEETLAIARALEDLCDFVNLSFGNRFSHARMIGAMHEPHGYQLPSAEPFARGLSRPVIAGGRITSLAEAERALAEGRCDLVSMVRASIADPRLITKSRAGREAEVRPCIGCNHGCVGGIFGPARRVGCAVNPGAGSERTAGDLQLSPAASPAHVVVVGGGPAGLEAARVAAVRGHRVTLFEAEDALGGQLSLARRAPHRGEIGGFVDWAARELARLGVDVRLAATADAEAVLAAAPDAVVVATGSAPALDGVQAAAPRDPAAIAPDAVVVSSRQVLRDGLREKRVLVLDDVGHYEAIAVTDALLEAGGSVVFATPFADVGPLVESSLSADPARARFEVGGVTVVPHARLVSVSRGEAVTASTLTARERVHDVEAVVLVCRSAPRTELAAALAGRVGALAVVGDADSPRFLQAAVRDAHRAAAAI
jgi:2,4-dienoyl-CoA reductase-like NADH-dependent reductase (Old Yellow Enzyme family)